MMGVVARTLPYAHAEGGTASAFVGADHSAASRYGVAAYGMGAASPWRRWCRQARASWFAPRWSR